MAVLHFLPACLTENIYIWVCFGSPLSLHKLYLCHWVQSPVYYTVSCDSRIKGKGTVMHWFRYNQTGNCVNRVYKSEVLV